MPNYERFGRFLFGALLIGSYFFSWGKWIAVALGTLFLVTSAQGLCINCKYKKLLNNIKEKMK